MAGQRWGLPFPGGEIAAEAEDLVGEGQRGLAIGRELQAAPASVEEADSEGLLELSELCAHGGLAQAQLTSGCRHAAGAGHPVEVEQVVVVEPFHGAQ